jgi:transcriptional regulator with XRE-family HTH domain
MLMKRSSLGFDAAGEYGSLLRRWRSARGLSQLTLATDAGISTRHLSFLENGRSQPSRAMVELLSGMLDVPLDDRNALLLAAGFAPAYGRRGIDAPDAQPLRSALTFILKQQEPYPAIVVDAASNIVDRNQAARHVFGLFVSDPRDGRPVNTIRSIFHPRGLRQYIVNWEEVAVRLLYKVHRNAAMAVHDDAVRMRAEVMQYHGVSALSAEYTPESPLPALMALRLKKADLELSFISTMMTLGMPCDVTLESLKAECFFPADAATERRLRQLADARSALLHT